MRRSLFMAAATASVAVLALSASYDPAAAQRNGGYSGSAHTSGAGSGRSGGRIGGSPSRTSSGFNVRSQGHVNRGGRHARHLRGGRTYGYAPFGYYDGGYAHGDSCGYYYRRALAIGSSYWWSRYYDCIED